MTTRLSTGLCTLLATTTGFAAAMANGVIEIRTGSQPSTADSPVTGTLLGVVTTDGLPWAEGAPDNGLDLAAAIGSAVKTGNWTFKGLTTGTAGWFRYRANGADAGGASTTLPRMDGSVAVSGADLNLNSISVALNTPHTIDSFEFLVPRQ